jgi:hypothetical protein
MALFAVFMHQNPSGSAFDGASLEPHWSPAAAAPTSPLHRPRQARWRDLLRRLGAYLLRAIVDLGYDISPVPLPRREDLDNAP